jgi:hypothetical protein
MSSMTVKQQPNYSWWERKYYQKGGTYPNPALNETFGSAQVPEYEFATEIGSPAQNEYPSTYFRTTDKWGFYQHESDMPETRILADKNQQQISQVGIMCPFVGTQSASHLVSRN